MPTSEKHKSLHFKATFLTGLLAIVPTLATVAITVWVFKFVTNLIPRILRLVPYPIIDELLGNRFSQFGIRIIGLFLIAGAVYLTGLFARNVVGGRLLRVLEKLLLHLPMVRTIYSTIQQIGRALVQGGGTGMFRQVVQIEYPKEGCYVLGFLTAEAAAECKAKSKRDLISIFVPTTPNPTSGFLLFVPREDVLFLEMTVVEGMRLVISGGAVSPHYDPEKKAATPGEGSQPGSEERQAAE